MIFIYFATLYVIMSLKIFTSDFNVRIGINFCVQNFLSERRLDFIFFNPLILNFLVIFYKIHKAFRTNRCRNRSKLLFFRKYNGKYVLSVYFSYLGQILDFWQPFLYFWSTLVNWLKIFLFLLSKVYFQWTFLECW